MPGISPIAISSYFRVSSAAFLLASYPGAAAAYSLRKLSPDSTSSIRVKRDLDNAETDIGFLGNGLDTATLTSFINGSNFVHIVRFYDQSGNDNHLDAAAPNQPYIVSGGDIIVNSFGQTSIAIDDSDFFTLTSTIDTNNDFSSFVVQERTGTRGFYLYNSTNGTPGTVLKSTDNKYYVLGEDGYISSNAAFAADEPVYLTGIYNGSVKKQYENGTELASTYTSWGATFTDPLTSSYNVIGCFLQEFILYLSDQSSNRAGIEANINNYYNIVQYGFPFDVEELSADPGIAGLADSATYYPLSPTELALFGGFGTFPATNNVTDKWWITTDGITFNEQVSAMPCGPTSHVVAGLRQDGLIWVFGRSQNLPGPVIKFYVATLNPTTKAWTVISSDVVGNENYLQWGFFHNDEMYGAFDDGSDYVLRKSSDGLTWTDVSILPDYAVDSSAWSDGTRIRFAGGGVDIAAPATDLITHVYESLDNGATFTQVSELPVNMRSIWPAYFLYEGYEIFISGAWGPTNDDWGKFYYRLLGNGDWTLAEDLNRRFSYYFVYPFHASAFVNWEDEMFIAYGARLSSLKVTPVV